MMKAMMTAEPEGRGRRRGRRLTSGSSNVRKGGGGGGGDLDLVLPKLTTAMKPMVLMKV